MSLRTTHILGILGAVVVFVATDIAWYTHDVVISAAGGTASFTSSTSYTLWDITTAAPVVLVVAAALAAIALFAPSTAARAAGTAVGLVGAGVAAYCVVKMFNFPDLGATGGISGLVPTPGGAAVGVSAGATTTLDAGPFIGLLGGALLGASGISLLSEAPAAADDRARAQMRASTPAT